MPHGKRRYQLARATRRPSPTPTANTVTMLTVHRCGHCKALTPEYEKLAKAMKGLLCVAAVDADEHKGIASKYGVKGFPTIKVRAA